MERKLNFRKLAQEELTLAQIMVGREKIDTDDVIDQFPDGLVIDEIEYVTMTKDGKQESFWAFHIKGTELFAFAGTLLSKVFEKFLAACEGDYEALYEEFKNGDGLAVKISEGKTKDGKNLTKVDIL